MQTESVNAGATSLIHSIRRPDRPQQQTTTRRKRYQANVAGEYGHSGAGSQGGIIRTLPRSLNCLTSVFLTNAQLGCLTAKKQTRHGARVPGEFGNTSGGISGESRTEAKAASYVKYALPQSFDIQIISGRYPHIMPEQQRKAAKRRIFGAACGCTEPAGETPSTSAEIPRESAQPALQQRQRAERKRRGRHGMRGSRAKERVKCGPQS
jgi:hypothetical protein